MVKVASHDALAILRKFGIANEENVPRHIEHLTVTHPLETNTVASFRFDKIDYFIVFDATAEDNEDYIIEQIHALHGGMGGRLLLNPQEDTHMTFGLPFKGKDVYLFQAKAGKQRLDIVLAEDKPQYSRSTWQKYIKSGYVTVNKKVVTSPKTDITSQDIIEVSFPDAADYSQNTLPIIYLDENVIVIHKPVGVLTHSKGALNDEFTVADFFRRYSTYNTDTNRPGIVHRLDRDTSGVMIGARNPNTAVLLQKQFANRKTKKVYYAVVDGQVKDSMAEIDVPIGRNPSAPSTFRADPKGKDAQTAYTVIAMNDSYSLLELRPRTGRTHQLRVHMAHLGTPIHGDRVYGVASDRLYLHAYSLEITIPTSNRQVFVAPMPPEFGDLVKDE